MNLLNEKDRAKRELLMGSISVLLLVLLLSVFGWDPIGIAGIFAVLIRMAYISSKL